MKYDFPVIEHIDDVLPAIMGDENFFVAEREGYKVINYLLSNDSSFPPVKTKDDAIRRECRGIIFDSKGYTVRRPYQKFFNVNEREETLVANIDWSQSHTVLHKLDGSMIAPFYVGDKLVWGTKMGDTDVAKPVQEFVEQHPEYIKFAERCFDSNLTPIFEWVSRKQRIVIDYPDDQLILVAIRGISTGFYFPYNVMVDTAKKYNVPVVEAYEVQCVSDAYKFIESLTPQENMEGVVVRFEDGHMIKIKTEWYVRIHKNKELVSSEKNLVDLIGNNAVDDVLPFLPDVDRDRVKMYQEKFSVNFIEKANEIKQILYVLKVTNVSRKQFALDSAKWQPMFRAIIFKLFDEENINELYLVEDFLWGLIQKHCTSNQMFAKLKEWLLKDISYE